MVFDVSTSSTEPLFSQVEKFLIRSCSSEEKERNLRITVEFGKSGCKASRNLISVRVSDDDDPFFYYSLSLTEEDYRQLKQLQGLLVDFDTFPSQFVRLLEQCHGNDASTSKFLLLLEEEKKSGTADPGFFYLKIVETNNFKHLNHLVLRLAPGNDSDIKKLMLLKIQTLKEQNEKAEKFVSELESQLFTKNKLLAAKEEELLETHQKWKEERLTFKAESSKELCEETEKLRKAQLEWQIARQKERNELEDKYQNQLKEKESDISKLRLENQILQDKRSQADLTISDQARRIESLENEVSNFRGEILSLRKQNAKIDSDYHEKDKIVNSLKTRLAVAEQEAKDLSILVKRQQEILNSANEQRIKLEQVLSDKEKSILRKQNTIQSLSDDLVKANSIIAKIQKDLSVVNQKLKVRTVIALEQEKVVESHQMKVTELEGLLKEREKEVKTMSERCEKLKRDVDEMNLSAQLREQKLKDQERLIDWLNRRLSSEGSKSASGQGVQLSGEQRGTSTPFSRPPALGVSSIRGETAGGGGGPLLGLSPVPQQQEPQNEINPVSKKVLNHEDYGLTNLDIAGDDIFFEIIEPEELRYTYRTRPAKNFGPASIPEAKEKRLLRLVLVSPEEGCSLATNREEVAGHFAFILRGTCSFVSKTILAEEAGARGVIISDDEETDEMLTEMIDDHSGREAKIPALFLLGKNGAMIRQTLKRLKKKYALINIPVNVSHVPLGEWRQPPWVSW